MAYAYILYSPSKDKYYIGATSVAADLRMDRHNEQYYANKYTSQADDWSIFLSIECETMQEALFIEKYIKKMKSRKYINDLKQYPEIIQKIKAKYRAPDL